MNIDITVALSTQLRPYCLNHAESEGCIDGPLGRCERKWRRISLRMSKADSVIAVIAVAVVAIETLIFEMPILVGIYR